jgi:hypothetical protein
MDEEDVSRCYAFGTLCDHVRRLKGIASASRPQIPGSFMGFSYNFVSVHER